MVEARIHLQAHHHGRPQIYFEAHSSELRTLGPHWLLLFRNTSVLPCGPLPWITHNMLVALLNMRALSWDGARERMSTSEKGKVRK